MPDPVEGLRVRSMTLEELREVALPWAGAEGWNPGLNDAEVFFATDPQGFFLAEAGGEPLGCISAVNYGPAYSFLGFFLVQPAMRGRGIGRAMSQAALAHAGERIMGLDGVVAQQANYRAAGFAPAFRSVRYARPGGGPEPLGAMELAALPWEMVLAYDTAHFPAPGPSFCAAGWPCPAPRP